MTLQFYVFFSKLKRLFSHLTQPCVLVLLDNTDTFFDVGDKILHDLNFILLCVSLNFHIWEYHLVEFIVKKFANGKFDYFPICVDKGKIVIVKIVHKTIPNSCREQLLVVNNATKIQRPCAKPWHKREVFFSWEFGVRSL